MSVKKIMPTTWLLVAIVAMAGLHFLAPGMAVVPAYVAVEERMLAERFGAEWEKYCGSIRRWI